MSSTMLQRAVRMVTGGLTVGGLILGGLATPAAAETISVRKGDDLQAAIDSANAGDVIEIRKGTYAGPIVLNGRSQLTIVGKGKPKIDGGNDSIAFSMVGCADIDISGIKFQNGDPNVVFLLDCDRISFTKCGAKNSDDSAIEIDDSRRIDLVRVKIQKAGNDGLAMSDDLEVTTDDCVVSNCKISQCLDDGIDMNGSRNQFMKISIKKVTGDGFDMDGGDGNKVDGLKVKKPLGDGLLIDGTNTLVTGCKVTKAGADGVDLDEGSDNIVENCKVIKSGENGIEIDTRNNVIRDNTVKKSGDNDLRDRVHDGSNTFSGNKFKTSDPGGLQ